MIDVELLEGMRAAAQAAALGVVDDARLAETVAQDVVAQLIRRGIAGLADPVAHAATRARTEAAALVDSAAGEGAAA